MTRIAEMLSRRVRGGARSANPDHFSEFSGLWAFVNKDDANKEDYMIKGSSLEFTSDKLLAFPTKNGTQKFAFTDHSFKQLCEMLSIPHKYLKTCPVVGRGSMQDQINARMEQRLANDFMIRTRRSEDVTDGVSGLVRAFLPHDFSPFDNRHLLQAVQRSSKSAGNFVINSTNLGSPKEIEMFMSVRMSSNVPFALSGVDDPHKIGFSCITSEVDFKRLVISALLWRLVCSNGMMGWGDSEVLALPFHTYKIHEFNPMVDEAIHASVRQEDAIKDLLERALGEPVPNPETYIRLLGASMKLGDKLTDRVGDMYRAKYADTPTRFHVAQAFTEVAQELPLDLRMRVETSVGRVMFNGARHRGRDVIDTVGETVGDS